MRKRPFLLLATEFLLGIVCVREQLPAWGVLAVLLLVYTTPWKERGMRKVLFAAGLPGMFLLGMLQMQRQIDFRQQYLQKLTDGQEVRLAGKIDRIEPKTRCVYYYLKDCTVEAESQTLPCNDVIAYVSSASHSAGQILNIEGTISLFTEASNEGMFDARQFYQSQKIDFGIWVTKISRVYGKPDRYRCALQNMKKRANDVIRHSIRDDGVLSAMLLGEKGSGCRDKIFVSESGDRPCACYFRTSYFPSGDGTVPSAAETTAYPVCDSSAGNDRFFDFLCGFKRKRGIYTAGGGHVSDLFVCGCDRICL